MILGPNGNPVTSQRAPRITAGTRDPWSQHLESASRSGFRGWFYFPTLEPTDMYTQDSRSVTAGKAWWLYNNVGEVRAIIDGLGEDEVDTGIWPKAFTSNPAFNKAVDDRFELECGRPDHFHAAEEENFYSVQVTIRRAIRLYGELFGQLLAPAPDAGSPFPALHLIQPHQIGNLATEAGVDQSRWKDGIYANRLGKALQFRVLTNKERTQKIDVSREDMLHFHDPFLPGQMRGISALSPITRRFFRYDEIQKAAESGMLLRERMAFALTKGSSDSDDELPLLPGATVEEREQSDGTKLIVQKIIAGETDNEVPNLPPGWDLKVVESERAQQTPEWLKWMLTSAAYSTGYPPEHVYSMAGLGNGTDVRRLQKRVQRKKNQVRNFQLVKQFIPYWYEFWIYQRIKAGVFDSVTGGIPENFLRHKFLMPADDTVDVAREGRLYDERLAAGNMSPDAYYALQERDTSDVEDDVIEMRERREKKLDELNTRRAAAGKPPLSYHDLWPANSTVAAAAANHELNTPAE
jgi:hypothetical protein